MFSVVFDFGNNEIYISYWAESENDATHEIREELIMSDEIGAMAVFEGHLINPKLLQAVEIREIEEQDDTI